MSRLFLALSLIVGGFFIFGKGHPIYNSVMSTGTKAINSLEKGRKRFIKKLPSSTQVNLIKIERKLGKVKMSLQKLSPSPTMKNRVRKNLAEVRRKMGIIFQKIVTGSNALIN